MHALVLLVEDNQDLRQIQAAFLKFWGFRVAEAQDGEEAIKKAQRLVPAVILLDRSLPRIDGLEVARRLKAAALTQDIPIIALSGGEPEATACWDMFLQKPVEPADLLAAIRRTLGIKN